MSSQISKKSIKINDVQTYTLDNNFKNNFKNIFIKITENSYVGLVVYKWEDKYKIWISYQPNFIFKINLINMLSEQKNNIIHVVIRGQSELVRNPLDKKYYDEIVEKYNFIDLLDSFLCSYSLEPYVKHRKTSGILNIKYEDDNLYYTDLNGNYQKIKL